MGVFSPVLQELAGQMVQEYPHAYPQRKVLDALGEIGPAKFEDLILLSPPAS